MGEKSVMYLNIIIQKDGTIYEFAETFIHNASFILIHFIQLMLTPGSFKL